MVGATARKEEWTPDWAVHPGEILAEHIEARGWSQAEFARLADLTPKLVSTIISGANPVTPETAIKLERVLGLKAHIWTGLQSDWDIYKARQDLEGADAASFIADFPIKELKTRGVLPDTREQSALLEGLLSFLGIGTPNAYKARMANLAVHHRQSKAFDTNPNHVTAWLLLGELRARALELPPFDADRFSTILQDIRSLTVLGPEKFYPRMVEFCQSSGVALILERPIPKTCLFGSARWIAEDRAIIQMSLRMKSNDHFWWTFFHEAAHILLHRGLNFADDKGGEGDGIETQADEWAENLLVGSERFTAFKATNPRSEMAVRAFAREVGIHPGIVVGMLQHHKVIPFTHLNGLKETFELAD